MINKKDTILFFNNNSIKKTHKITMIEELNALKKGLLGFPLQ